MAELIDKDELIQIIDTASDDLSERLKAVFIDIVAELPTTTESEIRAMAISEFAEKLLEKCYEKAESFRDIRFLTVETIDIFAYTIAEQLKEVTNEQIR